MEIPDVIVVNKADHPLTDTMVREIRGVLSLAPQEGWRVPIIKTEAARGEGVEELAEQARRAPRVRGGRGHAVRAPAAQPVQRGARAGDDAAAARARGLAARGPGGAELLDEVVARRLDPPAPRARSSPAGRSSERGARRRARPALRRGGPARGRCRGRVRPRRCRSTRHARRVAPRGPVADDHATTPTPAPRAARTSRAARCPAGVPGCRAVRGTVIYVERVDPDGDGDLHVVVHAGSSRAGHHGGRRRARAAPAPRPARRRPRQRRGPGAERLVRPVADPRARVPRTRRGVTRPDAGARARRPPPRRRGVRRRGLERPTAPRSTAATTGRAPQQPDARARVIAPSAAPDARRVPQPPRRRAPRRRAAPPRGARREQSAVEAGARNAATSSWPAQTASARPAAASAVARAGARGRSAPAATATAATRRRTNEREDGRPPQQPVVALDPHADEPRGCARDSRPPTCAPVPVTPAGRADHGVGPPYSRSLSVA